MGSDFVSRNTNRFDSAVIPCLVIASVNAYNLWNEHWAHWEHMPPLEERAEYSYQNMRTKNFFWGDGDKTALYVLLKHSHSATIVPDIVLTRLQLEREGQLPQASRVDRKYPTAA
jgi:hypothetical protein